MMSSRDSSGSARGEQQPHSLSVPEWAVPLLNRTCFHGRTSRPQAEAMLRQDGDYLVRENDGREPVLSVQHEGRPKHLRIRQVDRKFTLVDPPNGSGGSAYATIGHLIDKYADLTRKRNPLPLVRPVPRDESLSGDDISDPTQDDGASDRSARHDAVLVGRESWESAGVFFQMADAREPTAEESEPIVEEEDSETLTDAISPTLTLTPRKSPKTAPTQQPTPVGTSKKSATAAAAPAPAAKATAAADKTDKKERKSKPAVVVSTAVKKGQQPPKMTKPPVASGSKAKLEMGHRAPSPPHPAQPPRRANPPLLMGSRSTLAPVAVPQPPPPPPARVSPPPAPTVQHSATATEAPAPVSTAVAGGGGMQQRRNVYKYARRQGKGRSASRRNEQGSGSGGAGGRGRPERRIENQEWYHGLLPRDHITLMLRNQGDFIVRDTDVDGERRFVISIKWDKQHNHVVIYRMAEGGYRIDPTSTSVKDLFATVTDLVEHYFQRQEPLPSKGYILMNPVPRQQWELAHDQIRLDKKLGNGAFGEVFSGTLTHNGHTVKAAIKRSHAGQVLSKEQIKELVAESRLMQRLVHPNIVRFYGIAAQQQPVMIVMELIDGGGLDSYLHKHGRAVRVAQRVGYCLGAAAGCGYLHSQKHLHRDIACRNILITLGHDEVVKVSDFGLAIEGTNSKCVGTAKVPIRWLAPETLSQLVYSKKTDIWSYGVLVWEIFNDAAEPYAGLTPSQVATRVKAGQTMDLTLSKPLPVKVKTLIQSCWKFEPDQRPTFESIQKDLKEIKAE